MFKDGCKFDHIIIETTGLADPAPVIQTFCVSEFAQTHLELDATITVVDAKHIEQHIDNSHEDTGCGHEKECEEYENEAIQQIAFADRVLLNKTDLLPAGATRNACVHRIMKRIQEING